MMENLKPKECWEKILCYGEMITPIIMSPFEVMGLLYTLLVRYPILIHVSSSLNKAQNFFFKLSISNNKLFAHFIAVSSSSPQ